MQRALEAERGDYETAVEGLALKWEELLTTEEELQEYFVKFQRFIKEKDQKWLRQVNRTIKNRDIYNMRARELRVLQAEYEELAKRRAKVQTEIQQYSKFYQYLEMVVEASLEFQEVSDVVCRFHTLVATSSSLQQGAQEAQEAIKETKGQLSRCQKDKRDLVMQLNNQVGHLQTCLEDAQNERLLWESRWAHIQTTAAKKTLLLGTIKMATLNLFQSICGHGPESVDVEDTLRQLEVIQQYVRDLSDVYQEVSRKCPEN
ncbi:coiled-coil domain-containing protein 42-like [Mixophyes fleayi]|uniref:coiled-coil domain-containing protein 42-like n=1 Tax=Mixophyes fleayi TaxID=3061075 RepID=UPI003F4D972D